MRSIKYALVFLVFHLLASVDGQTEDSVCRGISRGTDFVIGFTSNYEPSSGELHIIVVAFSDNPTTVTISSGYQVDGVRYQETFQLPPRGYRRTTIPYDFRLDGRSIRSSKVLAVTANSEVSVYGANYEEFTTDAFLSLPNSQLGTRYVVVSARNYGSFASFLAVIGLSDNTDVHLALTAAVSFEGQHYAAGDVLTFRLDRHKIVQILSMNGDLSGTIIRGSSTLAAIGGHRCSNTPGSTCDTLIEQLIPVRSWGHSHIYTATGGQNDVSIYKIAVFFNATLVSVPGMGNRSLNAGEFWEVSMSGSGLITSSLPSSVTQILRYIDRVLVDPSIIQVPSEEQFAYQFGFATPPKSSADSAGFFNFANIVVKATECRNVTLNGQSIRCNETAVEIPGTDYVVSIQRLPKSEGVYFIEQPVSGFASPMSVTVYGYENDETYGYPAGLSLPNEGRSLSVNPFIVSENGGDIITATLPCLEEAPSATDDVICRFRHGTYVRDEIGVLDDLYGVVCPTYIFSHIGFTSFDVSLDGGQTFPYTDSIYVVSQYNLPPRVILSGLTPEFPFWDLKEPDSNDTILWNQMDFPNTTYVRIGVSVENSTKGGRWSDEIELRSEIPNNGHYNLRSTILDQADIIFGNRMRSIVGAIFSVSPSRSGSSMKDFFVKLNFRSELADIREGGHEGCANWIDELEEGLERMDNLPPCPPTIAHAHRDNRYDESNAALDIYHPGATACFRREAANGAGTQCCYGNQGELLLGPPGGGTADAFFPGSFGHKDHSRLDVRPWIACCHISGTESDDCKMYYRYRRAVTPEGYDRVTPARGSGDPHITTLDQLSYTFNAAGEFILLQSELHNVTFQGRMEQIPGVKASVFSAFALHGESFPRLQIQRSPLNKTIVLLDGSHLQLEHQGITLPKFTIGGNGALLVSPDKTRITVRLPFGLAIAFKVLLDMMSYIVSIDDTFRDQTLGLLGNFNGDPIDDLILPNGDVLSPNSSLREIHYNFGLKWMVNKSDSIFTYIHSENYDFFSRPEFAPNLELPNLDEIDQQVVNLCGTNRECLFDAVSTGSLSFANETLFDVEEYRETREVLQRIIHCNFPRDLNNSRMENIVYYVSSSYTFQCEEGFTLVGEAFGFCGEDGEWSWANGVPFCLESKTCTIPADFETGEASNETYLAGNSYEFSCSRWFFVSVGETLECNEEGNWNADFPSCVSVGVNVLVIVVLLILVLIAGVVCVVRVLCTRNKSII